MSKIGIDGGNYQNYLDCRKENGRYIFNWRKIKKSYGGSKERSITKQERWQF
jgi:hypothetical protein